MVVVFFIKYLFELRIKRNTRFLRSFYLPYHQLVVFATNTNCLIALID